MRNYSINKNNSNRWKKDVQESVMFYNNWFLNFAPATFIKTRQNAIEKVENAFLKSDCFIRLTTDMLKTAPEIITILRMATTPPLAKDRLMGLAEVTSNLMEKMEQGLLPPKMKDKDLENSLRRIINIVGKLLDTEIMPWLKDNSMPNDMDRLLAKHVIGDRVCGSLSDPIIRNEQERRQIRSISNYLESRGYKYIESNNISNFKTMEAGTFSYHLNVPVNQSEKKIVNMPIDVVIMRKDVKIGEMPVLIECKSAGDFTNTNKRRKEESKKIEQLRDTYGQRLEFILFLCGYFDGGYLGYEATDGFDWIWEHRIEDFRKAGI
jgi:hypothetical protein